MFTGSDGGVGMKKINVQNDLLIPEIVRLVEEGTAVTFTPKGSSMLPFIRGGKDSVELKRAEGAGVGDIVLARVGQSAYVIHRIIRIEGDEVTLMGDGNIAGKERCRREDVLALATKIIRNGKETDCSSFGHKSAAAVWKILLPARRYLLAVYRRIIK